MEKNIYKTKDVVFDILSKSERARGDDFYLYYQVISVMFPEYRNTSIDKFCDTAKTHNITPFESVRRCRQKIQSENENLKPSLSIQNGRKMNEEIMKNFALN